MAGAREIEDTRMAGFKVYTSNRMEVLAEKLAEILKRPLPFPFDQEIIIVQSRGMERWVSMELARIHGICANVRFPFPKVFVNELMKGILDEPPGDPHFEPSVMTWRIMRLLPQLMGQEGFDHLRDYLEDNHGELKRFQLSERIADLLDQYMIYRPDMITAWGQGQVGNPDERWQASVFHALMKESAGTHPAALKDHFIRRMRDAAFLSGNLPERISIFGISSLPYFHMDIFKALSHKVDVNLFLMNPCREFWFDIRSDRQISRELERYRSRKGEGALADALYLERGNPVLSSMGNLGKDFISYILDFGAEEWEGFADPGEHTLLAAVQSDILNLRDRSTPEFVKKLINPDDETIQIHSCHSPMREVEVLYDHLLAMFEREPDLLPKDILVMMPEIDTYAPYITAVFDTSANGAVKDSEARRIPFSIADRGIKADSRIVNGFLAILDLCGSRYTASAVMSILELDTVHRKFDLDETDVELVRHWVADSGIRWGVDKDHRLQQGLPAYSENTWKTGLYRLLLGYAMPGKNERLFMEILPYDHIEGEDAFVLGKFITFTDHLFAKTECLGFTGTLTDWCQRLEDILEVFFLADEKTEHDIQFIRRVIQNLGDMQEAAGFEGTVGIPVIRAHLEAALAKEDASYGFMTGDVTFCAMLPMRSIPFKVICLLGINNSSYPRQVHHSGFDLMIKHPRAGDRSRRHDDRYLFIEAVLSARHRLYISYVGQSIQDNTAIPPSVLVSELMDYMEQGFGMVGGDEIGRHLVTRHRLQAFNPVYFRDGNRHYSYSSQNCSAAAFLLQPGQDAAAFIPSPISEPTAEWRQIETGQLIAFFRNPPRFLLEKRLQMSLDEQETSLEESEPFRMKGLDRYLLEQRLVEGAFQGQDMEALWPVFKASGALPHGNIGVYQYHEVIEEAARFVNDSQPFMAGGPLPPLEVDLTIDDWTLSGQIGSIFTGALVHCRYANLRGKDVLTAWILHLILNCMQKEGYPRESLILCKDEAWRIAPVTEADDILASLCCLYWQGLTAPLKLFPNTSWYYAQQVHLKGRNLEEGMQSARRIWTGDEKIPGEGLDKAYRICFQAADPIDEEFWNNTEKIFAPLTKHMTKI